MCTWRVFALIIALLVLCADPPRTCEREGGVFSATFLVTWGGVAPCSESSNQIAEHVIICDDIGNPARDLVRNTKMAVNGTTPHMTRKVIQNTKPSFCFSGVSEHKILSCLMYGASAVSLVPRPEERMKLLCSRLSLLHRLRPSFHRFAVLQVMGSWAGPKNEAMRLLVRLPQQLHKQHALLYLLSWAYSVCVLFALLF